MNDVIFCFVALGFLAWVVVLKYENTDLEGQNRKMRIELERLLKHIKGDVDVMRF